MNHLVPLIGMAGGLQLAIAAAHLALPRRLRYRDHLSRVSPIIRQIFIVHSVYIVYVLLAFGDKPDHYARRRVARQGLAAVRASTLW